MTPAAGNKLGPYEMLAPLGAGGMGEVYRARDTKLGRDVALKVLPEAFAKDCERMARFQREAQMLASLNHPNIASIYGLEESGGVCALVMELVEGPTLAERIATRARGRSVEAGLAPTARAQQAAPLPLDEALGIAKQIAEALEAAHERSIIHRDLKPANIKVTEGGAVKVLDFGLAKAFNPQNSAANLNETNSPTLGIAATQAGVILGTAAYMSPEQARGKPVDKRTDIWSFGCVLYETLTGCQAFAAETVSDTIANVLQHEPDWDAVPAATPRNIQVLLRRCLQKDRDQRLHDIADARIEIDETLRRSAEREGPAASAPLAGRRWILGAAALGCTLLGALIAWLAIRPTGLNQANVPQLVSVARLTHDPEFSESPTWSPDGSLLAFASDRSGNFEIYVRRVDGGQDVNVTNDPGQDIQPAFSPDGNWIAFVSTRSSRTGMIKIATLVGTEFRTLGGDVWVVPALGGQARLLGKDGNLPAWHPSGRKLAYMSGPENHRSILEATAEGGNPRSLLPSESSAWEMARLQYSPAASWVTF